MGDFPDLFDDQRIQAQRNLLLGRTRIDKPDIDGFRLIQNSAESCKSPNTVSSCSFTNCGNLATNDLTFSGHCASVISRLKITLPCLSAPLHVSVRQWFVFAAKGDRNALGLADQRTPGRLYHAIWKPIQTRSTPAIFCLWR